ncbi:hypothetical protein MA16_Dca012517 [Dendrobium catenatum]|uniref:Uncharacterized protein n=1 Tax=Dendrobium catenatum TaxID=906689 RepID=A0A2I0W527_9ASPA|nr:hypothetical protein MA16_Dca012517 [Dendrobium catenatum]
MENDAEVNAPSRDVVHVVIASDFKVGHNFFFGANNYFVNLIPFPNMSLSIIVGDEVEAISDQAANSVSLEDRACALDVDGAGCVWGL